MWCNTTLNSFNWTEGNVVNLMFNDTSTCFVKFINNIRVNSRLKDKSVSINFILLLATYFIFKCKNRKEAPCMFQIEISISERRGLEEIIAFNRNKTDQHIEKWQHLY